MSILPAELLSIIFSYLPKESQLECMKVCSLWYSTSSVTYFQAITLTQLPQAFYKSCKQTRVDGSSIGDFVKTLYLYHGPGHLEEHEFHDLLENLPCLQVIRASKDYMLHLITAPKTSLKQIQQVSMEPRFFIPQMIDDHFTVNINLKEQITTLVLTHLDINQVDDYSKLLKILSGFTRLKKLVLGYRGTRNTEQIHLESVLDACKNLEYLRFTSDSFKAPTGNNIHSSLKSLFLSGKSLTEQHVVYFSQCLPNLKRLRLIMTSGTLEDLLASQSPIAVKQFGVYLKQMDYVYIAQAQRIMVIENSNPRTATQAFWNMLRESCHENCRCNLVIDLVPQKIRGASFKKENNTFEIRCNMPLDTSSPGLWATHLDSLTIGTIDISFAESLGTTEKDIYPHVIHPLLRLLQRQKEKQPFCNTEFRFHSTELSFHQLPSKVSGSLKGLNLQDNLLHTLGQLYPSTQDLVVEICKIEKEDERTNNYYIDLTQFQNICQLTLDFDVVLGRRTKKRRTMYIKLIDPKDSSTSEYYYYDYHQQNALYCLGNQSDLEIPKKFIQLKILCLKLERFTFLRKGTKVSMVDYSCLNKKQ